MSSTYLTRTFSAGNQKTFTFSAWIKFGDVSGVQSIFTTGADSENRLIFIRHDSSSNCGLKIDGKTSTSQTIEVRTNREFKDPSAWYHIVLRVDTTESAAADRVRLYVNGEQETSFAQSTYPSLNHDTELNKAAVHAIGRYSYSASNFFDGCMSHVHFADGQSLAPTVFGSTDSNSGAWKIITSPSFTLGTNGFSILQDGKTITDQSSNSNDFTLAGGTLTKTEDNPSNVFCTLNPNVPSGGGFQSNSSTWDHGNTEFTTNNSSSNYGTSFGTMQAYKGKWYYEVLYTSSSNQATIGISGTTCTRNNVNDYLGDKLYDYGYSGTDGKVYNANNSNYATGLATYSGGDYIGVFYDLDNNKIYFSKNGTMQNTTGITIGAYTSTEDFGYVPAVCEYNSGGNATFACNFGNGAFAGTQLTGTTYAGADGHGIFKYNPTSITLDGVSKSFNALSTKGLNA